MSEKSAMFMDLFQLLWKFSITIGLVVFVGLCFRFYDVFVAKPKKIRSVMMKQGISGPPPTLLLGNLWDFKRYKAATPIIPINRVPKYHDASTPLFPFQDWRRLYGDVLMFFLGSSPALLVTQVDMVREMSTCTSLDFGKPHFNAVEIRHLLGEGIATSNGNHWAMQKKLLAPPLFKEKVKGMLKLIEHSAEDLSNSWNNLIETNGGVADIIIDGYLRTFVGDVILKASLGINNYSKGVDIFNNIVSLQQGSGKKVFVTDIPGMKYLPSKANRQAFTLGKEIKDLVLSLVKERELNVADENDDLLKIVIEGSKCGGLSQNEKDRFIVDNVKQLYIAANETTATTIIWCFMLLAAYPEWQERVRDEVLDVCQGQFPDFNMILKMKQLDMVITETLRLYSPAACITRKVINEMKFGKLTIPAGMTVIVDALSLHIDPKIWGPDALEFKPERFVNGVNGATKHPYCYMPFGFGSRLCIGQNLAFMEIKLIIAVIVSRFSFTPSPSFTHCLDLQLLVKPKNGINLCIKKLNV